MSKKNERQAIKEFGIILSVLGIVMMIAELWLADGIEGINYLNICFTFSWAGTWLILPMSGNQLNIWFMNYRKKKESYRFETR